MSVRLLYRPVEAAAVLGVSRSTMYELIARSVIATITIGGRVLVTRPALEHLLGCAPPLPDEVAHHLKACTDRAR